MSLLLFLSLSLSLTHLSICRHMVQVVLNEISRPPGPELEFAENRESYSLAAGLALGLITLGVLIKRVHTFHPLISISVLLAF